MLPSLYLAERHLIVHFLGLLLILAVAALAFRAAGLLQGAPTAAVGAHRLSSERQGGHHRRSGRFVVKDPLDLTHYARVQLRDELKKHTATSLAALHSSSLPPAQSAGNPDKIPHRNAIAIWRLPANFGDFRTVDLYWMHRAEGTEHFHSLRTTRWPVVRKSIPVSRPERTRPAACPSISESPRRRTCPSTRTPDGRERTLYLEDKRKRISRGTHGKLT